MINTWKILLRRTHTAVIPATAGRDPVTRDIVTRITNIVLTSPNPNLEQSLAQSNIILTPETTELVLSRLENAGILTYRFFQWANSFKFTPTTKSYHFAIASLAKIRQYKLMWELVAQMNRDSLLNLETFSIIMRKYARAQKIDRAIYTFHVMDKYGVAPDIAAFNNLLSALCKAKSVRKAQEVFDEMSDQFECDSKTYSILLPGWGLAPHFPKIVELFHATVERGCEPDNVTYSIMVDSLCKAGRIEKAVEVVRKMRCRGCQTTSFIYSVLVHSYGVVRGLNRWGRSWRWRRKGFVPIRGLVI